MARLHRPHALVGAGCALVGLGLMGGALQIPSQAGYSGVGPNFLPWVVGSALTLCGVLLVVEAARGGFLQMEGSDDGPGHWPGFVWVSAALLLNAALITTIGFILSCSLCFVLAVRGFKSAEGALDLGWKAWLKDAAIGAAIAAPD